MVTEIRQRPVTLPFYYGWVDVFIAALAMVLLAASLVALPHVSTQAHGFTRR